MERTLRIHASVLVDLLEIMNYLEHEAPVLAHRFRKAFDYSLDMIRAFPEAGAYHQACLPETRGLRRRFVSGFSSYLILYRVLPHQEVEVLHVVHTARDLPSLLEGEGY